MTSTARPAPARRPKRQTRQASRFDRAIARGLAALERPEAPYLVLLAGFFLVGLFLRLNELGRQSLWFDEADAVMMARADLVTLIRNLGAAGQNGPLYILFLHGWMALFGLSEFAVRLPSALASAATIPLIYATGRALHGPKLGLYAAGILTIAPYQHWYAQEAKMYASVVLATLASTYLFILALRDNRKAHWIGYVIVTTLALYLHVTAALVLAAQGLYFVLNAVRGTRSAAPIGDSAFSNPQSAIPRSAFGWLAFAALTLPYLPIAAWELRFVFNGATTWHQPIGPLEFLRVSFTRFVAGFRADSGTEWRALALYVVLMLLGALPVAWRHAPWPSPALAPRHRSALLVLLLALPMALFYAVTLARPLFSDRYLIVVAPACYLLAAGGILLIERYARFLAPVALALILATAWVPLRDVNLNRSGMAQKEDWRAAYAHIAAHARPQDGIIIHPGYLHTTLDYYQLRELGAGRLGELPVRTIPAEITAGDGNQRFGLFMQQTTTGFERVWVVISEERLRDIDPKDLVRDEWFQYNSRLIDERRLNGVWLGLYAYNGPLALPYYPPVPVRLDVTFGAGRAGPTLIGYGYDYAPDESSVRPGGKIPLVLRWTFPNRQAGPFAIRWRLLDERGAIVPNAGGTAPLIGGRQLRDWDRLEQVWDYHDLPLPPDLAPGHYRLVIECVATDRPDMPLPVAPSERALPSGVPLGWIEVR